MSLKKNRHQRNAAIQAEGLAQIADSYMTATIVLSGLDTEVLPEAAKVHVKTALNVMAYTVGDIGIKYKKATGRELNVSHIEQAFLVNAALRESSNEQAK